jgi:hypothetical protein
VRSQTAGKEPAQASSPNQEKIENIREGGRARDFKPLMKHAAVGATLSALILLAWSNSISGGFVFYNQSMILLDSRVHAATSENLSLILNHGYWASAYDVGLYRPLTTLSYLFNYAVLGNGEQPAGYHWLNIFLHILNAFLVYALAYRFLRKLWPAAFIAALWSLHPILTESVSNIVGRADLLATLGVLSGLLIYLKSTESTSWRRALWLSGLMAVTTLGVFSKESAVVILGLILFYELTWWKERKQLRGLLLGCAALAPPFLLLWYQRTVVLTSAPPLISLTTDNPIIGASFVRGRLTALAIMAKYLWLLVWPLKLSSDYSYNQIPIATGTLHDWLAWGALLAVVMATAAAFQRSRVAFFFIGFGFISFLPASNLFFSTGTIMAERLLYMPSIGFAACLGLAAFWASRTIQWKPLAPMALCVILAALGVRTWERNFDWRDNLALWTSAVRAAPNSFKAHMNLASAINDTDSNHSDMSRVNQIIDETERGLSILAPLPDSMNSEAAHVFGGKAYLIKGDVLERREPNGQMTITPESRAAYLRSLEILSQGVSIDRAFNEEHRRDELARGQKESEIRPAGQEELYYTIAAAYIRLNKDDDAFAAAAYSATLSPQYTDAYVTMGDALLAEDRKEDAAISFMEGLLVSGDHKFLALLRSTYNSGLDTKGCSFIEGSQFPNPSCELVHNDICKASARLTKLLIDARQQSLADELQGQAIEESGCSRDELR